MPRAVAVNVAANTNEPGFRGPVYPDGSFAFVPIPEAKPTRPPAETAHDQLVPVYGDLELPFAIPDAIAATPVHSDPEFHGVHGATATTYGDPYGVKAGPIAELQPGDSLYFYATLTLRPTDWRGPGDDRIGAASRDSGENAAAEVADADLAPEWGAYLIGEMRVAELIEPDHRKEVPAQLQTNAHLHRETFDARVLVRGSQPESGLLDRVVSLSTPDQGSDANHLVTELSSDSGKGPWWRRPMKFDESATAELRSRTG